MEGQGMYGPFSEQLGPTANPFARPRVQGTVFENRRGMPPDFRGTMFSVVPSGSGSQLWAQHVRSGTVSSSALRYSTRTRLKRLTNIYRSPPSVPAPWMHLYAVSS